MSYQSVRQIEEDSAGFRTKQAFGGSDPKMQQSAAFNTMKNGNMINMQDESQMADSKPWVNPALYMSKGGQSEMKTMRTNGFVGAINEDLAINEQEEDLPNDIPYTMGEKSFIMPLNGRDKPRPPSNFTRPMSMAKFNEVNAPPRLQAQSLWPSADSKPASERMEDNTAYMRKSAKKNSVQEVISQRDLKKEQIHLLSQAVRDSQVNDHGTHYSHESKRKTPRNEFIMTRDEENNDNS